ncbi:DUF2071 domain-containing protein [Lignipirellula cremea]|uniref:DUF2071 domain-containing protein n=1 Tax=Lignipirellula cremea TaxID=2528010 RepID=A0A518DTS4_9BACT|nr:DUF2071 domain-containing protein [Lignipirellula cremea]QDU95242.1 hypothetical protein Pla8534_30570 [Lignipirellula cremea]
MKIPVVHGVIDRRILVNYRVAVDVLQELLPRPFRPQQVRGYGIAGICLIRLRHLRPWFVPRLLGVSSENAAHRIAVEWDDDDGPRHGVYIPRRDTSSRWNVLVGGRLFPGLHHHARFAIEESAAAYGLTMQSDDGEANVVVQGEVADRLPPGSLFASLDEVSRFFQQGSLGYSATASAGSYEGLELRTRDWQVIPLAISHVESSFFQNAEKFPPGSAVFDNALLMRGIEHEWHSRPELCAT